MSIGANGLFTATGAGTGADAAVWKPVNKAAATGGTGGLSALDKAFLAEGARDSVAMSTLGKALTGSAAKLFEQLDGKARGALEEAVSSGRMSAEEVVKGLRGLAKRAALERYEQEGPRTELEEERVAELRQRRAKLTEDPEYEAALAELYREGQASSEAYQKKLAGYQKGEWDELGAQYDAAHLKEKEEKLSYIKEQNDNVVSNVSRFHDSMLEEKTYSYNERINDATNNDSSAENSEHVNTLTKEKNEEISRIEKLKNSRISDMNNNYEHAVTSLDESYNHDKFYYAKGILDQESRVKGKEMEERKQALYSEHEQRYRDRARELSATERLWGNERRERLHQEAGTLNLFAGESDADILSSEDSRAADQLLTLDAVKKGHVKAGRAYAAGIDLTGADPSSATGLTPAEAGPPTSARPTSAQPTSGVGAVAAGGPASGSATPGPAVPGGVASQAVANGTSALSLLTAAAGTAAPGTAKTASGSTEDGTSADALLRVLKGKGSILV